MGKDEKIINDYDSLKPKCNALAEEVEYILKNIVNTDSISISEISVRVKTVSSLLRKIKDKDYSGIEDVTDLVGARIICLFRSDLEFVQKEIEDNFEVIEFDEKSLSDPKSFGYMSLHYQCKLKSEYSGPRYDEIKPISFEIQLRTICMHAWSAVQHALDYKGSWDVPKDLKKDINALSAIFYLADTQFSNVYKARESALESIVGMTKAHDISSEELNLDTIRAYAAQKFPDKHLPAAPAFSDLVNELIKFNYKTINDVDNHVNESKSEMELDDLSRSSPFNAIGAIRVSVSKSNKEYYDYLLSGEK